MNIGTKKIVLCLILILIIGLVVISGVDTTPQNASDPTKEEMVEIYSINREDILSVRIDNEYAEYTVLYGNEVKIKGKEIDKDDEKLKNLLSEVSCMYSPDIASENTTDFSQFGLSDPKSRMDITLKDGSIKTLYIGDMTPSSAGYYGRYMDDSTVYVIGTTSAGAVLRKLDYYRTTVLFSVEMDNIEEFIAF